MIEEIKRKSSKSIWLFIAAICLSLFTIYSTSIGIVSINFQRAIHLTLSMIIILLSSDYIFLKDKKLTRQIINTILIVVAVLSCFYLIISYSDLVAGRDLNNMDKFFGLSFVIVLLEVTRRSMGWTLPIIAILAILYSYFGNYLPMMFAHPGYSTDRLVHYLYLTSDGIFGVALGTSATFIAALVLFAAFLEKSGAGKVFIDLAIALVGKTRSGPATVAILSSSFMGSISGSAAANVMTTGVFTIPLMKRVGYKSHVAGGIESVASTGGQIMPPIMGAAAFIMAQYLGMPYAQIAIAALIPAILYYLGVFISVHIEASKTNMKKLDKSEIPKLFEVLKKGWITLLPLLFLIYLMLVVKYSPILSAMYAILSILFISLFKSGIKRTIILTIESLESGAKAVTTVASACGIAGILVGVFMLTGLAFRLSEILVNLSSGNVILLLIFTMVASMILGMGVPATPAYIIIAVLAVPSAIQLGVEPLSAHMFALYFAALANITPPVAIAAFAASSLTKDPPMKTAFSAFLIAIVVYFIPFAFSFKPGLLLQGTVLEIIMACIIGTVFVLSFTMGFKGWLFTKITWVFRMIIMLISFFLFVPSTTVNIVAIFILLLFITSNYIKSKHFASEGVDKEVKSI